MNLRPLGLPDDSWIVAWQQRRKKSIGAKESSLLLPNEFKREGAAGRESLLVTGPSGAFFELRSTLTVMNCFAFAELSLLQMENE